MPTTDRLFASAVLTLTFCACGIPGAEPDDEADAVSSVDDLKAAAAPAAWKVRLSKTQTKPSFETSFAIATTPDVYGVLDIPSATATKGQHHAAFEFISPDGVVFQRTEVPFKMGKAKSRRLFNAMPIAGTWIQQFQMTGAWKVRVFLDAEAAARATATFTLQ